MRRIVTTPHLTLAVALLALGLSLGVVSCSWLFCCDMGQMGPSAQAPHCRQWASDSAMSCCDDDPAVESAVPATSPEGGVAPQAALPAVVSVSAPSFLAQTVAPALSGSPAPSLFLLHASLLI